MICNISRQETQNKTGVLGARKREGNARDERPRVSLAPKTPFPSLPFQTPASRAIYNFAHCFSLDFESECLQRRKKELVCFRSRLHKRRQQNRFAAKEWASKLAESDKGSYYNQEKWLKDDKASEKPIETTAESSFTSFLSSGASSKFRLQSGQEGDEIATESSNKRGWQAYTTFTSCQNAAYSNRGVFICWLDYALEGSAFILSKCDFSRMFHTERS